MLFASRARRSDSTSSPKKRGALRQVAACGIPSPEVIAHGLFEGVPHLVLRFVPGRVGEHLRGPHLWRILGEYARIIQQILPGPEAPPALFSRFGREPEAAWHAHLAYNLRELTPDDPLLRLGGYPLREQPRLRAMMEELAGKQLTFGLSHGDLALRNLVVEPGRQPVLLDWGSASVGPAPHTDLLNLCATATASITPVTTRCRHLPTATEKICPCCGARWS
ncbi:MAG: aminoglycoside phosphotransferase family protein [Hymenobacter sp.]